GAGLVSVVGIQRHAVGVVDEAVVARDAHVARSCALTGGGMLLSPLLLTLTNESLISFPRAFDPRCRRGLIAPHPSMGADLQGVKACIGMQSAPRPRQVDYVAIALRNATICAAEALEGLAAT